MAFLEIDSIFAVHCFVLYFCFGRIILYPCFIYSDKLAPHLHLICANSSNTFLVELEQTRHPPRGKFSHAMLIEYVTNSFFGDIHSLCYISHFNSTVVWQHLVNFSDVIISGCSFWSFRTSPPKLVRTLLNSATQNFTVVNDGAVSPYIAPNSSLLCARYFMICIFTKTLT